MLYLDIETIPTASDAVRDYLSANLRTQLETAMAEVRAPANYKDADKIATYCDEKRRELQDTFAQGVAEAIAKTALDGSFGRVCVIGWAIGSGEVVTVRSDSAEEYLLEQFADSMAKIPVNEHFNTAIVGHNVAWDVRFLMQRYMVHGIKPPLVLSRAAQAKPWESDKLYDTMVQWAGVGNRISLDKLCLALTIQSPKGEIDGSKVAEFVAAGRIAEVADYCARDVEAVRAVHRRMTFAA